MTPFLKNPSYLNPPRLSSYFLGDNYLGIDSRFQLALLFLAFSANWCIHDVAYKRKSLGAALLSLAIENLLFGSGIWISLAFLATIPI